MGLSVARNKEACPVSYHIRAGPAKKRTMFRKALAPSLLRVRTWKLEALTLTQHWTFTKKKYMKYSKVLFFPTRSRRNIRENSKALTWGKAEGAERPRPFFAFRQKSLFIAGRTSIGCQKKTKTNIFCTRDVYLFVYSYWFVYLCDSTSQGRGSGATEDAFWLHAKMPLHSGSYEHRVPKIEKPNIFLYQGCLFVYLCDSTS